MNDPAQWLSFSIAFQAVCHPQQQQLSVLDERVHIYIFKKNCRTFRKLTAQVF